uniref:Glutamyl-tRNA reductase n=1 Tax=Lygus hesperus TaxID=30085 RepID=A0A0A9WWD1_LYGHE
MCLQRFVLLSVSAICATRSIALVQIRDSYPESPFPSAWTVLRTVCTTVLCASFHTSHSTPSCAKFSISIGAANSLATPYQLCYVATTATLSSTSVQLALDPLSRSSICFAFSHTPTPLSSPYVINTLHVFTTFSLRLVSLVLAPPILASSIVLCASSRVLVYSVLTIHYYSFVLPSFPSSPVPLSPPSSLLLLHSYLRYFCRNSYSANGLTSLYTLVSQSTFSYSASSSCNTWSSVCGAPVSVPQPAPSSTQGCMFPGCSNFNTYFDILDATWWHSNYSS